MIEAPIGTSLDTQFVDLDASKAQTILVDDQKVRAPKGSSRLRLGRRRYGDWYAEFAIGDMTRSAVALTRAEAVRNAAKGADQGDMEIAAEIARIEREAAEAASGGDATPALSGQGE